MTGMQRWKRRLQRWQGLSDAAGLGFLGLALFAVATNTQTGWLYFPSAFILVTLAFHLWAQHQLLQKKNRAAVISPTSLSPLSAGEVYQAHLDGSELGGLPKDAFLQIDEICPGVAHLGPSKVNLALRCQKRGRFETLPAYLCSSYPLGWLTLRAPIALQCQPPLEVLPPVLNINSQGVRLLCFAPGSQEIEQISSRHGPSSSHDFESLRPYQFGDELRRIHWRSSAKHGQLVVRQDRPYESIGQGLSLLVDLQFQDDKAFEINITLAYSLYRAAKAYQQVTLLLPHPSGWKTLDSDQVEPQFCRLTNQLMVLPEVAVDDCSGLKILFSERSPALGSSDLVFAVDPAQSLDENLQRLENTIFEMAQVQSRC